MPTSTCVFRRAPPCGEAVAASTGLKRNPPAKPDIGLRRRRARHRSWPAAEPDQPANGQKTLRIRTWQKSPALAFRDVPVWINSSVIEASTSGILVERVDAKRQQPLGSQRLLHPKTASVELALAITHLDQEPRAVSWALVAHEHVRTGDGQDADLAGGAITDVLSVLLEQYCFHLLNQNSQSDRSDASLADGRVARAHAGTFSEPTSFEHLQTGCLLGPAQAFGRKGCRAAQPYSSELTSRPASGWSSSAA